MYDCKSLYLRFTTNQEISNNQRSNKTTAKMLLFKILHLKPICKNDNLSYLAVYTR